MIEVREPYFLLETESSSYVLSHTTSGLLLHGYYGKKVKFADFRFLSEKVSTGFGTSILYEGNPKEDIGWLNQEYSFCGSGDFRETAVMVYNEARGYAANFKYEGYEILASDNHAVPFSYGENEVLKLNLIDAARKLRLELYYKVFPSCDAITRYARLINEAEENYQIERLCSLQLDLSGSNYLMMTFDGAWAKERHLHERPLSIGTIVNDSKTGFSSNIHNPLVILRKPGTSENSGECYGINLLYSGNHMTKAETGETGKTRILSGINDYAFRFTLHAGEDFTAPEAVLTYSSQGLNRMSQNFHDFVNHHIVRGKWKDRMRPILINTWEASYFHIDEKHLLKLAKKAKETGIELFVLDDGWFSARHDDTSSLGDWDPDPRKLPKGLDGFSKAIHQLGLEFGLWIEPEMISENSDLCHRYPEWAVRIPEQKPGIGRNQLVLDLTNSEVRNYLIGKMSALFSSCHIDYVKWDCNRNITDMYGSGLKNQGEFFHRYILGLYEVLGALTEKFPDILFEGCASGGNRFDLGMLCYFPLIWTSDDTDYLERLSIQAGTSYGYPLSIMSNHVSSVPNHQTLRMTPLASRFALACFGVLGYELDLTDLSAAELKEVRKQISFYKNNRRLYQFGRFYRGEGTGSSFFYVTDGSSGKAILGFFQTLIHPAMPEDIIRIPGMNNDTLYVFQNVLQKLDIRSFGGLINMVSPIKIRINGRLHRLLARVYRPDCETERYLVYGDALRDAGIHLTQQFMGTGYEQDTRVLGDFGTRIYMITASQLKYRLLKKNVPETKTE